MKVLKLLFSALLLSALLCGCTRSGIGDKVIVKAIFLDQTDQYTAHLLVLEATPSADAGSAAEVTTFLTGKGASLYRAIQQAEDSTVSDVFYGQNELLFLGPGLQQADLFASCDYLAKNAASGRPNMAVFGIDAAADRIPLLEESGKDFLDHIDQLTAQGCYLTYLYQMTAPDQNAVLPLLHLKEEGGVQTAGLRVYQNGQAAGIWTGPAVGLAMLLSGQDQIPPLELQAGEEGPVTVILRSPRLSYECLPEEGTLTLHIRLTGHVQQVLGAGGLYQKEERQQILEQLNRQMETVFAAMQPDAFGPDWDLFFWENRFRNQNDALTLQMEQEGTLFEPVRVRFSSRLKSV